MKRAISVILAVLMALSCLVFSAEAETSSAETTDYISTVEYSDYHGPLHVDGAHLKNQYNEVVQLQGPVLCSTVSRKDFYSRTCMKAVKNWGCNIVKGGLSTMIMEDDARANMFETFDNIIDLGMYVDIIAWIGDINNEQNVENAKDYFTAVATRYKDCPYVMYEICNEPQANWDEITVYANILIPLIRAIDDDAIIIVDTEDACGKPVCAVGKELPYDNILYSWHYYTPKSQNCEDASWAGGRRGVVEAAENGLPMIATEVSAGSADDTRHTPEDFERAMRIMDKYQISYVYYFLFGAKEENTLGMINGMENFSATGDEKYINRNGWYFRDILNKKYSYTETDFDHKVYNVGVNRQYSIWDEAIRMNTRSVSFEKFSGIPEGTTYIKNLSASGAGDINAYLIPDADGMYDIVIASESVMSLNHFSYFFNHFENLESVSFDNVDFTGCESLNYAFASCNKLKEISFSEIPDFSAVTSTQGMFANCASLEIADLSGMDFSGADNLSYTFFGCPALKEVKLNGTRFGNPSDVYAMFASANPHISTDSYKTKDIVLSAKASLKVDVSYKITIKYVGGRLEETVILDNEDTLSVKLPDFGFESPVYYSDAAWTEEASTDTPLYEDMIIYVRDASGHRDDNDDGICDKCGVDTGTKKPDNKCSCNCHKSGFYALIWKIQRIIYKLFGMKQNCYCGKAHY